MPRPRTLLSQQDWIDAGQDILRESGITGVKLTPLLARLKVTSGSFYHHFADFQAYLDALADHYGTINISRVTAAIDGVSSAEQLAELRRLMDEWDIPRLDKAMRVWAVSNERAAGAVRKLDGELLTLIRDALVGLGFSNDEARVRALLIFSAGAGLPLVFSPWPIDPDDTTRALELLITLPPS